MSVPNSSSIPHNPCATCGACCRNYIVPVCGYDVWLISTGQRLSPEQFLVAFPQEEAAIDAFYLQKGGKPYGLALDKQGKFGRTQPCVFLMRLGDGNDRCGIYMERPTVCRAYPMALWSGVVYQRKDSLCPPDSWPLREVVRPGWRAALQRFHMHFDVYREVISRWNARVKAAPEGTVYGLPEYFSFLMNGYDRLSMLDAQVGQEALREVEANWPTLPRPTVESSELRVKVGEMPWLDYLSRAREAIDRFYPEIPPQPLVVFDPTKWPGSFGRPGEDEPLPKPRKAASTA